MIRVLIAEDSHTTRDLLVSILSADPEIEVVAEANNGIEALELTRELRPDVVTMDIQMPRMDGLEATKRIMVEAPTPIVIVSASVDDAQVEVSMHALRAGAVSVLPKPNGPGSVKFNDMARQFVSTVKAMSQVKVVRHWTQCPSAALLRRAVSARPAPLARPRMVAIGASTGGPAALQRLLSELPGNFDAPILVVQHIASGFVAGLAAWLNTSSALLIKVAEHGEQLEPGTVYISPDDQHLTVSHRATVALSDEAPIGGFRPSASALFKSVADHIGAAAVAVILTGMGSDGIDGLREVRRRGGTIVAQDEASSVVFGMPAAAIASGLADSVVPLIHIASLLEELLRTEASLS